MQKTEFCVYRECNSNGTVRSIRNRYEGLNTDGKVVTLQGIPMLIPGRSEEDLSGYRVVVEDYGSLTQDNLPSYLEAELPLLLLGTKDWELEQAEEVLRLVSEQKKMVYLFNYLDGHQYRQAVRQMEQRCCFRIPYAPDPYARPINGTELEFLEELTEIAMERTRK